MSMLPRWYTPPRRSRMPLDEMFRVVARHYGVTVDQVRGPSRDKAMVKARSIICRVLRDRGISYPVIARLVGRRDHSTIIHLLETWPERSKHNPEMTYLYTAIINDVDRIAA